MTYFKNFSIFGSLLLYSAKSIRKCEYQTPFACCCPDICDCCRAAVAWAENGPYRTSGRVKIKELGKPLPGWIFPDEMKIDSVKVDEGKKEVKIWFPPATLYNPVREESLTSLGNSVRAALGRKFSGYSIFLYAGEFSLESLIPNYFRYSIPADEERITRSRDVSPRIISRVNAVAPVKGLNGRYIALWHSHGYYFDIPLDRWEWQRAKLFGSVEDISVMAYVLPYLAPMLENSGATVFLPRERDIQVNEVIVDNDQSRGASRF
jgi:hypothetical protein